MLSTKGQLKLAQFNKREAQEAKAIVVQKMTSFKLVLGASVCTVIGVAAPNRRHEIAPRTISRGFCSRTAGVMIAWTRKVMIRPLCAE